MKGLLILLLLGLGSISVGNCQMMLDKSSMDVGEIQSPGYVDIKIRVLNHSQDDIHLLRLISDDGLIADIDQSIGANSSGYLNVRVQPSKRGKFKKNITLIPHINSPIFFTISGKCSYVSKESLPCPDFGTPNATKMRTGAGYQNRSLTIYDTVHYASIEQHINADYSMKKTSNSLDRHFWILYDASASMNEKTKKEMSHELCSSILQEIKPGDSTSLLIYSQEMNTIYSGNGNQKNELLDNFMEVQNQGYTNGYDAIVKTLRKSHESSGSRNTIVLILTDGAFNLNSGQITSIISQDLTAGIQILIYGIEPSKWANRDLRQLAKDLGGEYFPVQDKKHASTISLNP